MAEPVKRDRLWLAGVAVLLVLLPGVFSAGADEEDWVSLEVKVVSQADETPVANARVHVQFKEGRFLKDKRRNWHSKTNGDGVAKFPRVPPGKLLIQVVAEGWKTFGKYYEIAENSSKKTELVEIKLEKPRRWY